MRGNRTDENQLLIVRALRQAGATVQSLAELGAGVPDILCGFRGGNWLMEIKNPNQPPSKQRLTPHEKDWHEKWQGQVVIVLDVDDALRAIGAIK